MLRWDETDFMVCLGVMPEVGEDGIWHRYVVARDGLRLELTIWSYDGDVYVTMWRDGVAAPLVDLCLCGCDAARWVREGDRGHLEFAASTLFGGRYDGESVIPYGIRVRVEPSLGLEFFRTNT